MYFFIRLPQLHTLKSCCVIWVETRVRSFTALWCPIRTFNAMINVMSVKQGSFNYSETIISRIHDSCNHGIFRATSCLCIFSLLLRILFFYPRSYLAGAVQVFLLLGDFVERQEGVSVASRSMANTVAFSEQAPLPYHLAAVYSLLQVLFFFKNLASHRMKPTG